MLCKSQSCCSAAITLRTPVFSDIRVTSALSIFSMLFLVPVHPDRLARRQLALRATLGSDVASSSSWGTRIRSGPRSAWGLPCATGGCWFWGGAGLRSRAGRRYLGLCISLVFTIKIPGCCSAAVLSLPLRKECLVWPGACPPPRLRFPDPRGAWRGAGAGAAAP